MNDDDRILYGRLRAIVTEAARKLPDVHVRDQIEAALEDTEVRIGVKFYDEDGVEWIRADVAGIASFDVRLDDWDPDDLLGRRAS